VPENRSKFSRFPENHWVVSFIVHAFHTTTFFQLGAYEYHILELRDEKLNVNKIIAVIDATFVVAKLQKEKSCVDGKILRKDFRSYFHRFPPS